MCLLIVKSAGLKIPRAMLNNADTNNPDGAGIAYVDGEGADRKLVVSKGWFVFENFYNFYKDLEERDMLIHFRAASPQMEVCDEMCHPFEVESDKKTWAIESGEARFQFAIGHNGRLSYAATAKASDTYNFVKDVIAPILFQNPWHFEVKANRWLMENFLGLTNKIAIMRYDREEDETQFYILNPEGGAHDKKAHMKDKIWFSNDSYNPAPKVAYGNYGGDYYGENWSLHNGGYTPPKSGNCFSPKIPPVIALPTSANDYQGLYQSEFTIEDKDGWKWSYEKGCWKNTKTGVEVPLLVTRPNRPLYIQMKEKRDAAIAKLEKEANEEADKAKQAKDLAAKAKSDQMQADFKSLTKEEFEKKYNIQTKKKVISVPRDEGVVEDSAASLKHLSKGEKRRLRRLAVTWWKGEFGNKADASITTMVRWIRSQYREIFSIPNTFSDEKIDMIIVQTDNDQSNPMEVVAQMEKDQMLASN